MYATSEISENFPELNKHLLVSQSQTLSSSVSFSLTGSLDRRHVRGRGGGKGRDRDEPYPQRDDDPVPETRQQERVAAPPGFLKRLHVDSQGGPGVDAIARVTCIRREKTKRER